MPSQNVDFGFQRIPTRTFYRERGLIVLLVVLVVSVVGGAWALGLTESEDGKLLGRIAGWAFLITFVLGLTYSVQCMVKSRWQFFLFEDGVLRERGGPRKWITWPDVEILYFFPKYRSSEKSTLVASLRTRGDAIAFEVEIGVAEEMRLMTRLADPCRAHAVIVNDLLETVQVPPGVSEPALRDKWRSFADAAARQWKRRGIAYALMIPPAAAFIAIILIRGSLVARATLILLGVGGFWALFSVARYSFRQSARYSRGSLSDFGLVLAEYSQADS